MVFYQVVCRGLRIRGDVGCGKTMLMDMLYDTLPSTTQKTRVHFHAFMLDMHKYAPSSPLPHPHASPSRVFVPTNSEKSKSILTTRQSHMEKMANPQADPLPVLTTRLAQSTNVLFLDEFQVTDIADAMILRRLLTMLLGRGMVLVTTSNRHPRDLYRNGIQRDSFVPAIEV
jgi:peroxisome-assembly ATPase